ncbi:MAG: lysylphosphatidylglycerol synthase transmembrane domain-containing protein [Gemmatimonadota bacterium]
MAWKAALGLLVSGLALWWVFRDVDLGHVAADIGRADPLLFLLSAAAATGVFWIRAWRWKALLEPVCPGTTFRSRFAAVTIGFMGNNLLPARVGEFARAYALSRMTPVPIVASFGSLVLERLLDGVFVVGFLFVAMWLPGFPGFPGGQFEYMGVVRSAGVTVLAAVGLLMVMVFWPAGSVRLLERAAVRVLPKRIARLVVDALEAFLAGVGALREPRLMARALAWSAALWLFNAVGFWIAFAAFDLELGYVAALFLQSVVALMVSVPSAPGFWGVFELAADVVLVGLWGQAEVRALAYAVGFHLAGFIPVTLLGLWYAWRLGLSVGELGRSEEVVEQEVERTTGVTPEHPRL